MKTITTRKDGSKLFVEVSEADDNYTFPADHPSRETTKTVKLDGKKHEVKVKMYQIPVVYHIGEEADIVFSKEFVTACGLPEDDLRQAANAGIKLAIGDAVKSPFAKEGGKKLAATAMDWLVNDADPSLFSDYRALPAATDADKSARRDWLLEAYRTR